MHRAYRIRTGKKRAAWSEILRLFLPFAALIVCFFPEITREMVRTGGRFFWAGLERTTPFLGQKIYFLDLTAFLPSRESVLLFLLVSLLCFVTALLIPWLRSIMPWIAFCCVINLVSSFWFLLHSGPFPYTLSFFSQIYMEMEVMIWFFIPLLFSVLLFPFSGSILSKGVLTTAVLSYSILFGAVRYILFLFLMQYYSLILMPLFFFAFGPYIDFLYIVGAFSFYANQRRA